MPTPNDPKDPKTQGLNPQGLANQLFDVALMQNPTDPRLVARQVIGFLTEALFYAVTSAKNDPIVFLTETLIYAASISSADEASRKELLKRIGETIAAAPPLPSPGDKKP